MGRERGIQDGDAVGTHARNLCSKLGRGKSSWKSSAIETFTLGGSLWILTRQFLTSAPSTAFSSLNRGKISVVTVITER